MGPDGVAFGQGRLAATLQPASRVPLAVAVRRVVGEVEGWAGPSGPQDDVSVVPLEVGQAEGRGPCRPSGLTLHPSHQSARPLNQPRVLFPLHP